MPFASKFSMNNEYFSELVCFDGNGPFHLCLLNIINKTSCRISEHLNSILLLSLWLILGEVFYRKVLRVFTEELNILVSIMSTVDFIR